MGSGKSTLARELTRCGAMVYYSDIHARRLMLKPDVSEELIDAVGQRVAGQFGLVDRGLLRDVVFSDVEMLSRVGAIMAPHIKREFEKWCMMHPNDVCVLESAIIYETGMSDMFDKTVVVVASEEEKFNRSMRRGGLTAEQAGVIFRAQVPQDKLSSMGDFVVNNCGDVPNLGWVARDLMRIFENLKANDHSF